MAAAAPSISRVPPVTVFLVVVVLAAAAAQALVPGWYAALARDGLATAPDEWWRVATALVAYDDGVVQVASVVVGVVVLGIVGEGQFGSWRWFVLFLVPGLFGQMIALAWQPAGAGSSVAVAGQFGAVAAWSLLPGAPLPAFAKVGPIVVLAGAVALVVARDIHGPPVLLGAVLGLFLLPRARRTG